MEQQSILQQRVLELLKSCENIDDGAMYHNIAIITTSSLRNPTIYTSQLVQVVLQCNENWRTNEKLKQQKWLLSLAVIRYRNDLNCGNLIQGSLAKEIASLTHEVNNYFVKSVQLHIFLFRKTYVCFSNRIYAMIRLKRKS